MPNIVLTNRSYQTTIRRSTLISLLRDAAACATIKRSNTALSPSEGLRLPAHQRKRQVTNHQSDAGSPVVDHRVRLELYAGAPVQVGEFEFDGGLGQRWT